MPGAAGRSSPGSGRGDSKERQVVAVDDLEALAGRMKRGDGVEYKVHAGKDAALYICIEPAGLTDCFGSKLH